jgi:hypothetical protein
MKGKISKERNVISEKKNKKKNKHTLIAEKNQITKGPKKNKIS